jgi:hypothetical protein
MRFFEIDLSSHYQQLEKQSATDVFWVSPDLFSPIERLLMMSTFEVDHDLVSDVQYSAELLAPEPFDSYQDLCSKVVRPEEMLRKRALLSPYRWLEKFLVEDAFSAILSLRIRRLELSLAMNALEIDQARLSLAQLLEKLIANLDLLSPIGLLSNLLVVDTFEVYRDLSSRKPQLE